MDEFFEEIIERAHYYEQFELFREYKQTFTRNQTGKTSPGERNNLSGNGKNLKNKQQT